MGSPAQQGYPLCRRTHGHLLRRTCHHVLFHQIYIYNVTRQGLLIWKRDFSTVRWEDSFTPGIMSAFILLDVGGKVVALFCLVAALICWVWQFVASASPLAELAVQSAFVPSLPTHPVQGLCSPTLQKCPEPPGRLWWTVPRKKAGDEQFQGRKQEMFF